MSILSRYSKNGLQESKSSTPTHRAKLYVLASQPATPGQSQTTEWSLELSVPRIQQGSSTSTPTSRSSSPRPRPQPQPQHKHSFMSYISHKHKEQPPTTPPVVADDSTHQETPPLSNHYYFSSLHPGSLSVQSPQNVILKIFLCSPAVPTISTTSPSTDSNAPPIATHMADTLSPIPCTPASTSWLRQALIALQTRKLIPDARDGLEANKFMGFATSYLNHHQRQHQSRRLDARTPSSEPRPDAERSADCNYSQIVRENERLRRMLSSEKTDYAVVDAAVVARGAAGGGEDEDWWMWEAPRAGDGRGSKWSALWVPSGSAPGVRSGERQGRQREERGDPYGGLM